MKLTGKNGTQVSDSEREREKIEREKRQISALTQQLPAKHVPKYSCL